MLYGHLSVRCDVMDRQQSIKKGRINGVVEISRLWDTYKKILT